MCSYLSTDCHTQIFFGSLFSAITKGCEILKRVPGRSLGTLIGKARTKKLLNHLYLSPNSSSSFFFALDFEG